MDATILVLVSLLAVVVSGFLSRLSRLPAPLVQMALGALICQVQLASVVMDPEVFFLLFLPPLLFLDGWRIPKDALLRDAPTVLRLALGLVLFTVLGVGLFIHWLIPALPLAAAFALAAVLSPTDPVAVSALAAGSPLPKRLMHILQGEALLNDASGLVCMRFAVATVLTGSFSLPGALASFAWLAAGGVAVGVGLTWAVARVSSWASERFGPDGGGQILITLLIPFGVYLAAEKAGCSGILAAASAGITMSYTDVWQWRAATRLRRTAVWDTVQLAANGSVFVLLGEQLPALLAEAPQTLARTAQRPVGYLLLWVVVIVAALVALRFAWVWLSVKVHRGDAAASPLPPAQTGWRLLMVMSLAGVRGAVTLAGVFTLPLALADRTPFPARDLMILLAAGVIVLSLLLASLALPRLLAGLELPPEPLHEQGEFAALQAAAHAAIRAIEEAAAAEPAAAPGAAPARHRAQAVAGALEPYRQRLARHERSDAAAPDAAVDALERTLRLVGLRAEREAIRLHGREQGLDDLVVRRLVRELDHQEARHVG